MAKSVLFWTVVYANIKYIKSFEMINKHNNTSYFLFFGTNHPAGLKAMEHAMWKVDPSGNFSFSDRTYGQLTLFSNDPDFEQLKALILEKFKGRKARIEEIVEFVVENTSFLDTHIKKQILQPMEYADPPELEVLTERKRKGTFSDGTIIRFL